MNDFKTGETLYINIPEWGDWHGFPVTYVRPNEEYSWRSWVTPNRERPDMSNYSGEMVWDNVNLVREDPTAPPEPVKPETFEAYVLVSTISGMEYYGHNRSFTADAEGRENFATAQLNTANILNRSTYTLHMDGGRRKEFNVRNIESVELVVLDVSS